MRAIVSSLKMPVGRIPMAHLYTYNLFAGLSTGITMNINKSVI